MSFFKQDRLPSHPFRVVDMKIQLHLLVGGISDELVKNVSLEISVAPKLVAGALTDGRLLQLSLLQMHRG